MMRRSGTSVFTSSRTLGFSLVEMLVAMAILALSLGALYQAAAGATRNVRVDERYTYAVQIAQSLLAEYPTVPPEGISRSGESGDFSWRLASSPWDGGVSAAGQAEELAIELLQLDVMVRWEGSGNREVHLVTIVPQRPEEQLPEAASDF